MSRHDVGVHEFHFQGNAFYERFLRSEPVSDTGQVVEILGKAPAKINLYLRVFEKRLDGFHRIETAMLKVAFFDEIKIRVCEGQGILVHVRGYPELDNENNLACKAARLYLEAVGLEKRVEISIQKEIFVAAGLGGGSSDAACVLESLERLCGVLSQTDRQAIAQQLGSDVPFFLGSSSLGLASGRGESVTFWPDVPPRPVLLVNPGFEVSTAKAYQGLARPLTWKSADDNSSPLSVPFKNWNDLEPLFRFGNDLEAEVTKKNPEIGMIRKTLEEMGASRAQMSGSGGTVFGFFDDWELGLAAQRRCEKCWKTCLTKTGVTEKREVV